MVRSLYYLYPPFASRLTSPRSSTDDDDLALAEGSVLLRWWHRRLRPAGHKEEWRSYLHLRRRDPVRPLMMLRDERRRRKKAVVVVERETWDQDEDNDSDEEHYYCDTTRPGEHLANPEDGCMVIDNPHYGC